MKKKKITIDSLTMTDIRSLFISYVYQCHEGNQVRCAKALGISPNCVNEFHAGRSDRVNKKIIKALSGHYPELGGKITKNTLVYYTLE